jgi:hypothetical protein
VEINSGGNVPCPSIPFQRLLTSGTSFTFSGSANYAYCVQFQNVPGTGLPTFGITWTT